MAKSNGAVFCSQRINGGGNQSGVKLAEMLGYDLVNLYDEGWKNADYEYQVWYMNDDIYKLQDKIKDRTAFLKVLSKAKDIKVVLNFVIANTWKDSWLLDYPVSKVIFLNEGRVKQWCAETVNTRHSMIEVKAMLPPINLDKFTNISRKESDKIRIGRHSRISLKYPPSPENMYKKLDRDDREFSFMIAHNNIKKAFPFWKYYDWNELSVEDYLEQIDIYLCIINPNTNEQGGRSNMEAMAAGCCVIVEDRDAMPDYIEHGETGFLVKSQDEAVDIINNLTKEEIQRIGYNAYNYAFNNFKPERWIKELK